MDSIVGMYLPVALLGEDLWPLHFYLVVIDFRYVSEVSDIGFK